MNERHQKRTLDLLREADLVYTCVDEPQVPLLRPARGRRNERHRARALSRPERLTVAAAQPDRERALHAISIPPRSSRAWVPPPAGSPMRPRPSTCS